MSNTNINNQVTKKPENKRASALEVMANRLTCDPAKLHETLKNTVFQKASPEEMLALVAVANVYDLNPLLKEIYAFPAKGGGIVPIVSVDGWNKMLVRQENFDGIEFEFTDDEDGSPVSCTAIVYIKNRSKPVKVTEYYAECRRDTPPWKDMPRRMLRNRTLCQAARMAFGFSGVQNDDEAATITVEPMPAEPLPKVIAAQATTVTPQSELESLVVTNGKTFDDFRTYVADQQLIPDADSLTGFGDLDSDFCKRMIRAQKGLIAGLNQGKA